MKNIHVLPTDNKPSRLYFNINDKEFQICEIEKPSTILKPNRHIYITNDEEPKAGDYSIATLNGNSEIVQLNQSTCIYYNFKIILTTDQDLIKDGVQAIDDEFLEWFVKNPSCEEVEIEKEQFYSKNNFIKGKTAIIDFYKIIIPKEEPFKHEFKVLTTEEVMEGRSSAYEFIDFDKNETLEEAIDRIAKEDGYDIEGSKVADFVDGMVKGAKWQQETYNQFTLAMDKLKSSREGYLKAKLEYELKQQERSYSEEDIKSAFKVGFSIGYGSDVHAIDEKNRTCEEWFEQFKKK